MNAAAIAVLVVDDDPGFLRAVQAALEQIDGRFAIETAANAAAALALLHRDPGGAANRAPVFVVLDFHLPDCNAPAVLARLRARPELRDLPVLVLSGTDREQVASEARAAGATRFLVKPSHLRALRAALAEFWQEDVHGTHGPVG